MPARAPLTPAEVAAVVAAIRGGGTRNDIARQLNVGAATVSKIARDHGLSFDRAATVAATAAKVADAAAQRAQLELDYLADAQRLRGLLWKPHQYREVGQFQEFDEGKPSGAKYSDWLTYTQDTPTPADQLKLMQASTLAATNSQKIADSAREAGVEEARSMLGTLFSQLGQAFRTMQAEDLTTEPSQETP